MVKYFWDSYAVIELLKNNPSYKKYGEEEVIMSFLNLVEITYSVFREYGEKEARKIFKKFLETVVEPSEEIIISALKFKSNHAKQNLSYADCVGYQYALHHTMFFLTGDKEFKDLPKVSFVK